MTVKLLPSMTCKKTAALFLIFRRISRQPNRHQRTGLHTARELGIFEGSLSSAQCSAPTRNGCPSARELGVSGRISSKSVDPKPNANVSSEEVASTAPVEASHK